jgi:hypothetical protein
VPDFRITSNSFFVGNAKNLSYQERVHESDLDDRIRNASELVVIVAATFIGKLSLFDLSNLVILSICICRENKNKYSDLGLDAEDSKIGYFIIPISYF